MKLSALLIVGLLVLLNFHRMTREENNPPSYSDPAPLFTFGLFADAQYCNCEAAGTRYYKSSLLKLQEAFYRFKKDSVKFIINLGDLIERDFVSYKAPLDIISSSNLKVFHCTGNHDYSVQPAMKKRIPLPDNHGKGYYSFVHNRYRFIILNGNEISTYSTNNRKMIEKAGKIISEMKVRGESNAVEWNGGIGTGQIDWLNRQLSLSVKNNELVFVFCHFPVWPVNIHNLLNYNNILSVLKNYDNIIAWFSGHNHQGSYANLNLIHFVTLRGMVETEESNSYAIVEVYRNRIWIWGFGRETERILAY